MNEDPCVRLWLDSLRGVAFATLDERGFISRWTACAEQLYGIPEGDILGRPVADLHPVDESVAGFLGRGLSAARETGSFEGEAWALRRGGAPFWARVTLRSAKAADGSLAGFAYVVHDRSEVRDLALALATEQEARVALEKSMRFLESIVENVPNMIFVKEAAELRFARINRAGELLLGVSRERLIGRNDYDFFPPEQASFFQARDRETLRNGQVVEIAEEPIQTAVGERWLSTKKVPLSDLRGEAEFLLGISEDITERRVTAAALQRAKEAAEAANSELESFSYSVAHDLRAPLRAMSGFSLALLRELGEGIGPTERGYLRRIAAAAEQMGQLIDALLSLSRVTRVEMKVERVDLTRLAEDVAGRLRAANSERVVHVLIQEGQTAMGDPQLLRILFENLLGNAWKYTQGKESRIAFVSDSSATPPVYRVSDNGAGFDMAYASRLFRAFQRLHSASEFEGTGIGLATAHRIVKRHGGRIWAESTVGQGATFSFTLKA